MKAESAWPRSARFRNRYRVDDLVPELASRRFRAIMIGESPHRDEVAPQDPAERSPFRGVAGRHWWAEVGRFLAEPARVPPIPPRAVLLDWCQELRIAIINSVQYPLDPRIVLHEGEDCSPEKQLGFAKVSGALSFRKSPRTIVAVRDLAGRLEPISESVGPVLCLGADARWFADRALALLPERAPLKHARIDTIPHPASWWRRPEYRKRARDALAEVFGQGRRRDSWAAPGHLSK
jgi:hypothetical protein